MRLYFVFLCTFYLINAAIIEKIVVDMSYVYDENVINHSLWKKFEMTSWIQGEEMTSATHMGTHMDAPSHFSSISLGGLHIDQIPIYKFIAPAAVINIEGKLAEDPEALVLVEDLEDWDRVTGQSLNGTIVPSNSGWGKKWQNRAEFLGTEENDMTKLQLPGISREAALWLVDNRNINLFDF